MISSKTAIHSQQGESSTLFPDLTPLLDLVFIVMVFLLLTTNIQIKTMDINIPQTEEESVLSSPEEEVITINILAEKSTWAIQGKHYNNWNLFTQALLQEVTQSPKKTLIIAADREASVEAMLQLLSFLQKNQISATNIMMEEKNS